MEETPCPECGGRVAGGRQGCQAGFEALLARDFSDPRFMRWHRLFVDVYCLQHPAAYCASAKSLAAHLAGLCAILQDGTDPALGDENMRRWLDGSTPISKPPLPASLGALTLMDMPEGDDPELWGRALQRWAEEVWGAYRSLHGHAREWLIVARGG